MLSCKLCLSKDLKRCRSLANDLYFEGIPGLEFIGSVLHINVDVVIERTESHVICYRCYHNLNSFSFYYNIVQNAQRKLKGVLNCHSKSKSSNNYRQFMNDELPISNFPFGCRNDKERLNTVKQEIVEIVNTNIVPDIASVRDPLDIDKSKSDNLSMHASVLNDLSVPTNEETLLPHNVALKHLIINPSDVVKVGEIKVSAISTHLGDNVFKNSSDALDIESQENDNILDSELNDNVFDDEGVICVQTKKKKRKIRAPNKDTVESLVARQKMFDKYKLQEMYINNICVLNEEQTDEMCRLFFKFTCEFCKDKESYTNYKKLIEHSQTEHKAVPQVQCCCGIHVAAGDGVMDHIAQHILFAPRHIVCKLCGKLIRRQCYPVHLSSHLPPNKRNFPCDQCSLGFHTKSLLKAHIDRIHNKKSHICEHCNKDFSSVHTLKLHVTRVHTPDGKTKESFMCEECGKVFFYKSNYVYHMKTHKGNYLKIKCPTCDLVLNENALAHHIRHQHKPRPLRKCPHCDYTTKYSLTSHINRVHIKEKKLNCSFCDKKFPEKKDLRFHVASRHTGIPQYSCEFCDKQFMSSGNCFSHKKRMHPQQLLEKKMKQSQLAEQAMDDILVMEKPTRFVKVDDRAMTILEALKDNSHKRFAVDEVRIEKDDRQNIVLNTS